MASKQKRKRERKKRAQGRSEKPASGPYKKAQFGPLELVLEGREMSMRVDKDHPDYEAFHAAQAAQAEETPKRTLELRAKIAELCEGHHAFDVVHAVWMTYGVVFADTLQSYQPDAPTRVAEYVAHVLLDRPDPHSVREPTKEELRGFVNPKDLGDLVVEILSGYPIWFTHRQMEEAKLDPWLDLRSRFYMHRLAVSSFTYEWQEIATLHELFDPFSEPLREEIGYDGGDAIACAEAMGPLLRERAMERGRRAREFAAEGRRAIEAIRRGEETNIEIPEEWKTELPKLSREKANRYIDQVSISWMTFGLGVVASFTAAELAAAAEVETDVAEAFLKSFSVDFGRRADAEHWERDPEKALGGELETMRERPILHDGEGKYLPSGVDTVFYGIRDRLISALNGTKNWSRFDRHRAKLLETRAIAAIEKGFGADWSYGGVIYRYLDENGDRIEGEADGVIRAGTVLILVEAKAGSLAPSARRTAPKRLEKSLKDLVVAAHEQLGDSYAALVEGKASEVVDAAGKALEFDLDGISRVIRVAVSLEDLSPVAPAIWQLQEADLLPADERAPWVVGIHELELICDLRESPGQLLHYVLRRQRSVRQHVWAMDEMDFFMRYLDDGLYFEDELVNEKTEISLQSHTDPLDAYLYGEQGKRPRAKRPKQRMKSATRSLLSQIADTGSEAAIEAQAMILEMNDEGRERISAGLRQMAKKTQRDGKPHDMTLVFGEDFAVSIHSVPPALAGELPERLARHGSMRAKKSNLRRWLGLGTLAQTNPRLHTMTVMLDPERLEED